MPLATCTAQHRLAARSAAARCSNSHRRQAGLDRDRVFNFSNQESRYVAAGSLIFDAAGNLYGALDGGSGNCDAGCGSIFKLSNSAGVWTETGLFFFDGEDGFTPTRV